jgi:hypothetical protein
MNHPPPQIKVTKQQNTIQLTLHISLHVAPSLVETRKVTYRIPIVQPTKFACYFKLFIIVKRSTCFERSFRPSSGAQDCVYSNGICQTAAAIGKEMDRSSAIGNEIELRSISSR